MTYYVAYMPMSAEPNDPEVRGNRTLRPAGSHEQAAYGGANLYAEDENLQQGDMFKALVWDKMFVEHLYCFRVRIADHAENYYRTEIVESEKNQGIRLIEELSQLIPDEDIVIHDSMPDNLVLYSDGLDHSGLEVNSHLFPEHEECLMCGSNLVTITDDKDICHDCGFVYE
jgi:hypothetical protein